MSIKQMILDFKSKAEEATRELVNTHHSLDRVRLVQRSYVYRECAERLETWDNDITKYHDLMGDIWNHTSTYTIVQELKKRYPTELKLSLSVLEILEQIRRRTEKEIS